MPTSKRKTSNWLAALTEYVEETESPRTFWLWAGLFCLSSALQRRTWLKFGMDNLYPNLYIMIIAPPGRCRKGAPVGFAKRILSHEGIKVPVFVDSPTKRALTKMLAELGGTSMFYWKDPEGKQHMLTQSPLALVSKELSSFLATDAKSMIEILTELFDSHDEWEYKTSEKGTDKIYGVCINCIFASTPSWIAANLPEESVGGGFTSRFVVVPAFEKYKSVPIPKEGDSELFAALVADLAHISHLVGEFKWSPEALAFYEAWYMTIEPKVKATHDERMHGYLERMHIIAIKVSMCLSVNENDNLIINLTNIRQAIALVEEVLSNAPKAFGALGRSLTALLTDEVRRQLRVLKTTSFKQLMQMNYHNTNRSELKEVIRTLEDMGQIKVEREYHDSHEIMTIHWIPKKERNYD